MRVIVIGNEKGGAGKSTVAVHLAVALMHDGASLAVLDLDRRQQSMAHFFSNRARWAEAKGVTLPHPQRLPDVSDAASLSDAAGPDPLATCNLQPATPEPASDPDPFALQLAQLYNRQNPHPVNLPFLEPHTLQPANGNPHP